MMIAGYMIMFPNKQRLNRLKLIKLPIKSLAAKALNNLIAAV